MNYTQNFNDLPENTTLSTNNYHPYSLLAENKQELLFHTTNETNRNHSLPETWNSSNSVSSTISQRGIAGFVSKLYQCLQAPHNEQRYARWCKQQGRDMFVIEHIPEFTEIVLPRLFKHCKFPSFVRQLNIYGFQRDTDARKSKNTKDKDTCRWYHPYFKPGRRDLFHLIRRKATRYTRKKKAKYQEDSETILRMDDEDEDSIKYEGCNQQSFSSSSSVTLEQTGMSCSEGKNLETLLLLDTPKSQFNVSGQRDNLQKLYQERQQYEKVHSYYSEQLTAAHNKIKEQKMHIQRLEAIMTSNTKPKSQEDYINAICSTPYYNSTAMYNNNLPFPLHNPVMSHVRSDDNSQNWISGYSDSIYTADKESDANK